MVLDSCELELDFDCDCDRDFANFDCAFDCNFVCNFEGDFDFRCPMFAIEAIERGGGRISANGGRMFREEEDMIICLT